MTPSPRVPSGRALRLLALLALLTCAYFAGVLTERWRFDARRQVVIDKYERARQELHRQQMEAEKAQR